MWGKSKSGVWDARVVEIEYDTYPKSLIACNGTWQETELSDDLKWIYSDTFIRSSDGENTLVVLGVGGYIGSVDLTNTTKNAMIKHYGLEPKKPFGFNPAVIYRTPKSHDIIDNHNRIMWGVDVI